MAEFSYPHTCPDIDKNIKGFEQDLESYLSDLFEELCPPRLLGTEESNSLKNDYVKFISDMFNNYFEHVRTLNSDMRDEAENQLKDKCYEIEELAQTIVELERKIEDLEDEVSNIKST